MYNWDGTMYNLAKWNGTQWQPVDNNSMAGGMVHINCFEIYNGELYIGGSFNVGSGNPSDRIARWDGSQWLDVGGGIATFGSQIYDMKVFNGELWAGGNFSMAGGVPTQYIAKWDGINWCGFGDTLNNGVNAIEIYNNELYIGGGFLKINSDTMNYIAKWIGGNFTDTCGNTSGINEENTSNEINIFPNPSSGIFTIESSERISSIEISNVLGEKIYSEKNNSGKASVDLSTQPKGIYFIKVVSYKFIQTKKVIIN